MKIIVFGSTGGTGRLLVKQALDLGYTVTAFARNTEKLNLNHPNLKVTIGDVLNADSVTQAIQGQDAVLCAVGMPNIMDKTQLRTKATRNIITAMKKSRVSRLICQSSHGAGKSYEILPWYYKFLLVPLLMRHLFADHNQQESDIKKSNLEWTIVRPATLVKGTLTNDYHQNFTAHAVTSNKVRLKISRADTANFMLKQLLDNNFLHKTPSISY